MSATWRSTWRKLSTAGTRHVPAVQHLPVRAAGLGNQWPHRVPGLLRGHLQRRAVIDQWTCNGQTDQELQFVATSGGYGELQVENSGQDVTVLNSSTAQGTPDIVQEPVNGNAASQWLPSQSDGSWQFQNRNSGLCLDVYGDSSKTGQQLEQWTCKNGLVTTRAAS